MMFLPLYMNLDPEKREREREREEVRQVMLQHLKHQLVLTGITTWMTSCPPQTMASNTWCSSPLHEPRSRIERKGKRRDSSSHAAAPQAPTCVNWDDDMDDFMPPNHGLQHMMFLPLYMNLDPEKREWERQEVCRAILHHLQYHHLSTGMTT